jgi:hypothetical protein
MSIAEFAMTDAAILAEIERREPSILATNYGLIDAGPFGTLVTIVANSIAFGELAIAKENDTLWLYGPSVHDYSISKKPRRATISSAKKGYCDSRQSLRSQLVIRSEDCTRCQRHVVEHTDYFRVMRNSTACREFSFVKRMVA